MPDNKIIAGSVVAVAAIVAITQIDFKTKVPGPADNDKCVAQLVSLARDNTINCVVSSVHISKAGPANGFKDDDSRDSAWLCNGGMPTDQDCLSTMAGGHDLGAALKFVGVEDPITGRVNFKVEKTAAPIK